MQNIQKDALLEFTNDIQAFLTNATKTIIFVGHSLDGCLEQW